MMIGMFVKVCIPISDSYVYNYYMHAHIGMKKKLTKLGSYKDCDIINDWTKSIINHICTGVLHLLQMVVANKRYFNGSF